MAIESEVALLDAAHEALDGDNAQECLSLLARLPVPGLEARALEIVAWLDLGELERAAVAHREGVLLFGAHEDEAFLFAEAEYFFHSWQIESAIEALGRSLAIERGPVSLTQLAACHDVLEDYAAADSALEEAHALAPDEFCTPARMTIDQCDAVVGKAMDELDESYRKALENTQIVIEPMPFADLAKDDPMAVPPDTLGLFVGPTLEESAEDHGAELPPVIFIFQRNIERGCATQEELRREIRITLYHEIGHRLGLDEHEVDALGLG